MVYSPGVKPRFDANVRLDLEYMAVYMARNVLLDRIGKDDWELPRLRMHVESQGNRHTSQNTLDFETPRTVLGINRPREICEILHTTVL